MQWDLNIRAECLGSHFFVFWAVWELEIINELGDIVLPALCSETIFPISDIVPIMYSVF